MLTQGLEIFGVRVEENLVCKTFILLHAALCVCVANNLGMICNEILGSKECPLGMFFGQHASFLEPHESPSAAAIPLRGVSKTIRNSRSFITAFFAKAQYSFPSPLVESWNYPVF